MEKTCSCSRIETQRTQYRSRFNNKKEEITLEQEDLEINSEEEEFKVRGHSYNVRTIQQSLELLIECGISFRRIEKVFNLFNNFESQSSPSFTCIRKWLGRIGIYELKREKEYRNDWIFIVDFTIELGKQKALVILGVSQQYLVEEVISKGRGLLHEDMQILGLEIMNSTKGELIQSKLDKVTQRVGVPVQIVADHSSDLARGINLYQQKYPELICTHDVTHGMALILKHKLNSDERYQSFIQKCNISRQRLQQTELSFLSPPTQRSQCRYFNIERLTNWAINLLNSPTETLIDLIPNIEPSLIYKRIKDKLGWLVDYELDLNHWNQMVKLTRSLETQLKLSGLNNKSLNDFIEQNKFALLDSRLQDFQQQILNYLTVESSKIKGEDTFLATSDVIESLFGKYKLFSARCPFKEMGQMLLIICLSTMNLTADVIKNALLTVSFSDVKEWLATVFGQSVKYMGIKKPSQPCPSPQGWDHLHERLWKKNS